MLCASALLDDSGGRRSEFDFESPCSACRCRRHAPGNTRSPAQARMFGHRGSWSATRWAIQHTKLVLSNDEREEPAPAHSGTDPAPSATETRTAGRRPRARPGESSLSWLQPHSVRGAQRPGPSGVSLDPWNLVVRLSNGSNSNPARAQVRDVALINGLKTKPVAVEPPRAVQVLRGKLRNTKRRCSAAPGAAGCSRNGVKLEPRTFTSERPYNDETPASRGFRE